MPVFLVLQAGVWGSFLKTKQPCCLFALITLNSPHLPVTQSLWAVNHELCRAQTHNAKAWGRFSLSSLLLQVSGDGEKLGGGGNQEHPRIKGVHLYMQYWFSAVKWHVKRHQGSWGSGTAHKFSFSLTFTRTKKNHMLLSHLPPSRTLLLIRDVLPIKTAAGGAGKGHGPSHRCLSFQLTSWSCIKYRALTKSGLGGTGQHLG